MKTKLFNFGRGCWQLLCDVPGWPNASRAARLRRALPIVVPCVAVLLLLGWNRAVRDPAIAAAHQARQPLLVLESEIAALRLSFSEQQAAELASRAAGLAQRLVAGPQDLEAYLANLKRQAAAQRWEASFQAGDVGGETLVADAEVMFLPARGKLTAPAGQPGAFIALVGLLDRFSLADKRLDLTRLAIRADEQGRYTAEVNLRLACNIPHEKAIQ